MRQQLQRVGAAIALGERLMFRIRVESASIANKTIVKIQTNTLLTEFHTINSDIMNKQ